MEVPILMYHYVRPKHKRLSNRHNVLDLDKFCTQLEFICETFNVVVGQELTEANLEFIEKPDCIWLTFDDGYQDCITYVLPELLKVGARATFYIPTEAIFGRKLLDVNKIHILLSGTKTPKELVRICADVFNDLNIGGLINSTFEDMFRQFGIANTWNDAETEFLKKIFQKVLPTDLRKQLLDTVFAQLVVRSESDWVDELYLSPDDVVRLNNCGMEIGSHGHSHDWLENLNRAQQISNLEESFRLIESQVGNMGYRTMSYPYGSYNSETLRILSNLSVNSAVVFNENKPALIDQSIGKHLELDRIDIMFFDQFIRDEYAASL